jgi:PAP2 superfamily
MHARQRSGRRELILFAAAYLTYFGVRALTQGATSRAVRNALDVMHLERLLHIDVEGSVQAVVAGSRTLVQAANGLYIWGHWPLLIIGGVLLFHLAPEHYYRLRNVCLLSGAFGLVVFALFPVAPPRLAPSGLIDTVTLHARAYRTVLPASLVNEYAAMPSFHAGWNLVLGVELFRSTHNPALRAFAIAMPAAMAFAVVATANHYVLDVLAGALAVSLALLVVTGIEHRRHPGTVGSSAPIGAQPALPRRPSSRQRGDHAASRGGAARAARRG